MMGQTMVHRWGCSSTSSTRRDVVFCRRAQKDKRQNTPRIQPSIHPSILALEVVVRSSRRCSRHCGNIVTQINAPAILLTCIQRFLEYRGVHSTRQDVSYMNILPLYLKQSRERRVIALDCVFSGDTFPLLAVTLGLATIFVCDETQPSTYHTLPMPFPSILWRTRHLNSILKRFHTVIQL